jgi:hypothetical protein
MARINYPAYLEQNRKAAQSLVTREKLQAFPDDKLIQRLQKDVNWYAGRLIVETGELPWPFSRENAKEFAETQDQFVFCLDLTDLNLTDHYTKACRVVDQMEDVFMWMNS